MNDVSGVVIDSLSKIVLAFSMNESSSELMEMQKKIKDKIIIKNSMIFKMLMRMREGGFILDSANVSKYENLSICFVFSESLCVKLDAI